MTDQPTPKPTDEKNYQHDYPTPPAEGSDNTEAK